MKKLLILLLVVTSNQIIKAQDRVITTGVPFLMVAADARAAGLADQGVATTTDAYSQQWNPAKYAFALDKQGFAISYTPYLTQLVNDISLGQVNYYNRLSDRNAFAVSLRYFSLGEIELRQNFDDAANVVKPNELALDGSYSLKLNDHFSMAVGGRYIRSNLKIADVNTDAVPGSSFAVDVAGYYQSEEIAFNDFNGRYRLGFNFQNMGPKISYDNTKNDISSNFLPANMRLGGAFDFILDEYNKVSLNVEFAKLMVPTPQDPDLNGDGNITAAERDENNNNYKKINWVSGMLKSFGDAPGGFSEELKEFTYSAGTEYSYQDSFAMRLGYFHESPLKGARKFFSLGAGFKYNVVKVDVSYLFSASKVKNPLENTLRFSLTFNFGDKYDDL
ncbi:type IX secretion system outer membrane channel protein PorV [Flavobacterium sp. SUN052]|uniref:type IX secretion system outer membrane channel protein PorV n=1 Tax=Flavobacterium sp. SUN052 TaxID=3002441 RepID=UPI00237DE7FE|nr:type IX secretion system outer membrane channel protein PorV [Flavobacterium sp. SUN052]MEC4004586.1 type IX secretion system outer membrane channel protein PorV [Flavobacterium sp. SUN052]